jgi:type I restriction enzyme S subunit
MQGKLVPQDPNDQPASELLKEIEAEKERLIKEGKIKKSKPLPEIKSEEIPYEIPASWQWVRFFTINVVRSELVSAKDYPLEKQIAPDSIEKGSGRLLYHRTVEESGAKGPNNRFYKNQILYSKIRPSLNKAVIAPYSGLCSADMYPIKTFVAVNFMLKSILSEMFLEQVRQAENRVKMPKLNLDSLGIFLIPLPPLAEQRRIVAKIDELMARCDELERLRSDRDHKQITVHTAAINRLLIVKEQSDFNTAWQFITQHFGQLYSVKENVSELRKAILQLAVMGKLVPQDPVDVPAAILLKEIRKRVNELVYQKEEREIKFDPINVEDEAFLLPESWLWVRLGSLLQNIKYGTAKKCAYDSLGTAVLRIPNINVEDGGINVKDLKYTHLSEAELKELYLKPFDILIIRSNGSESLVGRSAVVSETEEGLAYAGYLVRLRSFSEYIYSPYIRHALNTVFARKQIEQPLRTTSGVKNINSREIANLLLPLPPFPEQHRIAAKIDQLMALCDNLEKQIDSATSKQTGLLNAVITKI